MAHTIGEPVMSQTHTLQLLKDLGGRASSTDVIQEAKRKFPDRSLHSHITMRLEALERQKLVSKQDTENGLMWEVTDRGEKITLENQKLLNGLDDDCLSILSDKGIDVVNIVATTDTGIEMDLFKLDMHLSDTDYHAEVDSKLSYSPKKSSNVTLRVPSSGRITVAGAKSKEELIEVLDMFSLELNKIDIDFTFNKDTIKIQNIVGVTEIDRELDLSAIASDFDSGDIEYDPDNFPGLIFRPQSPGTVLLFRTGKIIFLGVKSCNQILSLYDELIQNIPILEP